MLQIDLNDTQPIRKANNKRKRNLNWLIWVIFGASIFLLMGFAGIVGGYQTAVKSQSQTEATESLLSVQDQFELGVQDFQSGQYDLARQRFEWVLANDPSFPGAADKLVETMQILYATATPTELPATPTQTPTPDLRPVEELFDQARGMFADANWTGAIEMIVNLRNADPAFHVVEVDGMLYQALRSRGIEKIKASDLEGGMYDLALAERFGPLDGEAVNYRELARLYMFGSAFWEAFPERAVYYFGQLASAAPGLRDASGWTARERYRVSLVHYGDQLARAGDWCAAEAQYNLALSMGDNGQVAPTAVYAEQQCYTPTPTNEPTPTETPTETLSPTSVSLPSETPMLEPSPTLPEALPPTDTPEATIAPPTDTPEAADTPHPTETATPEVLPTEPPVLDTSTPSGTSTPEALIPDTETPSTELPVSTEAP